MFLVFVRLSNVCCIAHCWTKIFSAPLLSIVPSTFPSKHFGAIMARAIIRLTLTMETHVRS